MAIAERFAARGAEYVDATILGSSAQVADRDAIVLVGGDDGAVAAASKLISHFARRSFHLGTAGAGSRMKLAANLVLGLNRAALAEGLAFASQLGIDPRLALEVFRDGAAYSKVMDTKGEKMLTADFTPQARLQQHRKDVALIIAAAARSGSRLPLSESHAELLDRAIAAGYGAQDNSAVIKAYESPREKSAGVTAVRRAAARYSS